MFTVRPYFTKTPKKTSFWSITSTKTVSPPRPFKFHITQSKIAHLMIMIQKNTPDSTKDFFFKFFSAVGYYAT
jgi:hypothetical protein